MEGKGLRVYPVIQVNHPLVLFLNHLKCFLRLPRGQGKGNVFIDLLDIWGLGISLELAEMFAFYGILCSLGLHVYAGSHLLFFT